MTFSKQAKDELMAIEDNLPSEKLAVLAALLKINGRLAIKEGRFEIKVQTENIKIAQFITTMLKEVFKTNPQFSYFKNQRLNKENYFIVSINDDPLRILKELNIMDREGNFNKYPSYLFTESEITLSSYLRGAFLASGSINDPSSNAGYHLEIAVEEEEYAKYLASLMNKYHLNAKVCKRRNKYITYLKRGESIADFLKLLKANDIVFYYEDFRIERDYENNSNRATNCYCANEQRRKLLADKQLRIINYLEKNNLTGNLDEKSKRIIMLRKNNHEGSLNELANEYYKQFSEVISKSTVRSLFLNLEHLVPENE